MNPSIPLADAPIGVFDSGVGGLSVLRELRALLPAEDFVYVADTGHCPYGTKPQAAIQERALAIARFLLEDRRVKGLVVACNTATVAAVGLLRQVYPDVPIVAMEPAVKPAAAATRRGIVGVLATGATLGGERFAQLVERFADGVEVLTQPCPGLVEQVEAGELNGPRTTELLGGYLKPMLDRGADAVVLGCTHYPFLRETISQIVGPDVRLIDSGAAVARQTQRVFGERGLLAATGNGVASSGVQFFTTGDPQQVAPVVARLWGQPLDVQRLDG